jgi:transcriptional regulator with XRE-family HTH domain
MAKQKQTEASCFSINLNKLMQIENYNQSKLSRELGFSITSVNNYLNDVNDPPVSFLLSLKKKFHINIDDFLTKVSEDENLIKTKQTIVSAQKYAGNYMLYFYQSSAYKGAGFNPVKDPLKYGVLSVFPKNEMDSGEAYSMVTLATFFASRQEAKEFKKTLDGLGDYSIEIEQKHKSYEQNYRGTLSSTMTQVFINLKSDYYNDRVLIILNNPPSEKAYVGGIGTVNSVARGREPSPVIQYIILSKYFIEMPDGELYNMLSLGVENIDVRNETMKLLEQFKSLYLDSNINLEEYQKNYIMQNNIERSIVDTVKRNMFLYGKISNREDDKYYRLIMSYKNK